MTLRTVKSVLFILFSFLAISMHAQDKPGVLTGKVIDNESGEEMVAAGLQLQGTSAYQAIADLNGSFNFQNIKPGTYNLKVNYLGYTPQNITGIDIKPGEVTTLNIALVSASFDVQEVVIEARAIKNSEVAILSMQKNSLAVQDGISSQEMSRAGSNNAAESVKQVTGASVEDGKYMVVRGLGDRYSITQVNGVNLPSTDPYRNSTSLDLIPSYMLDNIITAKTFTPDQPGNFTGGKMDITTKSFPDKFTVNFNTAATYNTQSSFQNGFLTYKGGKNDWLGYDDGTRGMPELYQDTAVRRRMGDDAYIRARRIPEEAVVFDKTANALNNDFVPAQTGTPVNHAASFSFGNQHKVFGKKMGYVLGMNYSRNFSHYGNGASGGYYLNNPAADSLQTWYSFNDTRSTDNPNLGGMSNLALQLNTNNELSFNVMYNHDAEKSTRSQFGKYPGALSNTSADFYTNSLTFKERELINAQLKGKHNIPGLNHSTFEWSAGRTSSKQEEPDLRFLAYSVANDTVFSINNSEYDNPFHFFRSLHDIQNEAKFDFTAPLNKKADASKIKVGAFYSQKNRDFDEYRFQVESKGATINSARYTSFIGAAGDINAFFAPENFGILDTAFKQDGSLLRYGIGNFIADQSRAENFYTGTEGISAAYAMGIFNINKFFKAVGGLRVEHTDIEVVSEDTSKEAGAILKTDFLPSVNLIFALSKNTNIRASASQTIARPNMRELAPFASFDFIGGFYYLGNPELERTLIRNYDLRFETYPKSGELFAVSAYVKDFHDPIVKVFNPSSSNPEIIFDNMDKAVVAGAEFEYRKIFLKNFKFGTNISLIYSRVEMSPEEANIVKQLNPEAKLWRPFQGQSPYILNANLSYSPKKYDWESTLSFNVSGPRLSEVSLFGTPDIYEMPRPTLNFVSRKTFKKRYQIGITAANLLNPSYKRGQTFKGGLYDVENYKLGRSFGIKLAYIIK